MNCHYCFLSLLLFLLNYEFCAAVTLNPSGKNVCSKTIEYEGYILKQSAYVGYENYQTCCGLFCWSKCQKSRPVRKTYSKAVKRKMQKTTYFCCAGWSPVGNECTKAICSPPCVSGTCEAMNQCKCYPGFSGARCENDLDECGTFPPVCDHFCQNLPGSYACSCMKGYQKVRKDQTNGTCQNINECSLSSSLCTCAHPNSPCKASCHDTMGSYECKCSKGYKLIENKLCVDDDECHGVSHNCDHFCFNAKGVYTCGCREGYVLDKRDNSTCVDINECHLSNGGCEQGCENLPGSYYCKCRKGFQLLYDKRTCQDENECVTRRPCDPTRGVCENNRGGFTCKCNNGFKLHKNGFICEDENECLTGNHDCSHECRNLIGDYECTCPSGFALDQDGFTCRDDNECRDGTHNCEQTCVNEIGGFKCACRNEYVVATDGRSCRPKPCHHLPPLENGRTICPSVHVGSNCSNICDVGYKLHGDEIRTCQIGQKWTGAEATCLPLKCPPVYPPMNGKIMLPCIEYYGSRCVVKCDEGYYLQGDGFLQCDIQKGKTSWNFKDNVCKAIRLCTPNPCLHGGRCYTTSKYTFKCDCRNTGYVGDKCQLGIVEFPSFPTLQANSGKEFTLLAKPDRELIIKPEVPNKAIVFSPSTIAINHPYTRASFIINTTDSIGRIRISFTLSGMNQNEFAIPASTVIRVVPSNFISMNRQITKDIYTQQCNPKIIGACPDTEKISFHSSCGWNGMSSKGHISVGTNKIQVPFSVSGFSGITNKITLQEKEYFTPRANVMNGLHKGSLHQIEECSSSKCNNHLTNEEHEYALRHNLFVKSYLHQIAAISPWWLSLYLDPSYKGFDASNFQSLVYKGAITKDIMTCPNIPELPSSTYSIFTSKVPVSIQLMSNVFTINKISTSCIVVDLCKNTYYMSLPVTRSIDISKNLRELHFKNTYLFVSGLSISKGEKVGRRCLKIYNRKGSLQEKCIEGNIWSKFLLVRRKKTFNVTFDGDAIINVADVNKLGVSRFDESYEAIANGKIDFSAKLPVAGRNLVVEFSDKTAKAYKYHNSTLLKQSDGDVMKLTTNYDNVRFNYDSTILTFGLSKSSSQFQINLFYHIIGGSVQDVSNQAKLRINCRLLHGNLNGILLSIKKFPFFKVQASAITAVINSLNSAISELPHSMKYKDLFEKMFSINLKLHGIQGLLEGIEQKIKSDVSNGAMIQRRIKTTLSFMKKLNLLPEPKLDKLEEKFNAISMNFNGKICLHKLCIDSCYIESVFEAKSPTNLKIKCKTIRDQYLSDEMLVKQDTLVSIDVSTISNHYQMNFNASVSIFKKVVDGRFDVNQDDVKFYVDKFNLIYDVIFLLEAKAKNNPFIKWTSLNFNYKGTTAQGRFTNHITYELNRQMKDIAHQVHAQTKLFNEQLSDKRFEKLEQKKMNITNKLEEVEKQERVAKLNLNVANLLLQRARKEFKSYQVNYYLRNYKDTLNKYVCTLKNCPSKCINTRSCDICQQAQTVNVKSLKCKNVEKKIHITKEEEFDTDCQEIIRVFETIYTGNCKAQDTSSSVAGALPDFGAGIGHTFGGPVGALIGGLSGGIVGQFFHTCENTWEKYEKKVMVNAPCKKLRLHTQEQKWQQSECGLFQEKIMSQYGSATECNCTNTCIKTQDPVCLKENYECQNKRKLYLESLLAKAGVFNDTATKFMECEKNVTLYQHLYQNAVENVEKVEKKNRNFLIIYDQTIRYKKGLQKEMIKMTQNNNAENCLKDQFYKNVTTNVRKIELHINAHNSVEALITLTDESNQERNVDVNVNLYNIKDEILDASKQILSEVLCSSKTGFGYSSNIKNLFTQFKVDKNIMCNQVTQYLAFLEHSINALKKLSQKIDQEKIQQEKRVAEIKNEIEKIKGSSSNVELLPLSEKLQNELDLLTNRLELLTPQLVIIEWLQEMEIFTAETKLFDSFGFIDSTVKIFNELTKLRHYSGYNPLKYKNNVYSIKNMFQYFFRDGANVTSFRTFKVNVEVFLILFRSLQIRSKFCLQYLFVKLTHNYAMGSGFVTDEVGERLTLDCWAKSENEIRYSWYHNQKLLPREISDTLQLDLTPENAGAYRCKVDTVVDSNITEEVIVKVFAKPKITENPQDVDIIASEEKGNVTFTCNVTGIPEPKVEWFYTTFSLKDNKLVSSEKLLTLNHNPKQGFYYCKATNIHGSAQSKFAKLNILESCAASQVFSLTFDMPREEVAPILTKIFYSESAKKAWSTSKTQRITLSVSHNIETLSRITFKLADHVTDNAKSNTKLPDKEMLKLVSIAKRNMVQLLKNVLHTMSVKVNENSTIAEMRENLRSTLLLEPVKKEFCPPGFVLHESQYKCVQCRSGYYQSNEKCRYCEKGYFAKQNGMMSCQKCHNGKTTLHTGSIGSHECQ